MGYIHKDQYLQEEPVFVNRVSVRDELDMHAHEFLEIAFIEQGCGTHILQSESHPVREGDLLLINYDTPHSFVSQEGTSMTVCNCIFTPAFFDYSLIDSKNFADIMRHFLFHVFSTGDLPSHWHIHLSPAHIQNAARLYESMQKEYLEREFGFVQIIRAHLIELLMLLFRTLQGSYGEGLQLDTQRFSKIIRHIEDNYMRTIRLEELSMMCFVSPTYFSRIFKEHTGCTFKEYVQKLRIEEACKLLCSTDRKILDISLEVGYSDLKHFNAIFKKHTGLTPSKFKKNSEKKS